MLDQIAAKTEVSTHSRSKAAAHEMGYDHKVIEFQLTAARRRLLFDLINQAAGWAFQLTAARRRLQIAA